MRFSVVNPIQTREQDGQVGVIVLFMEGEIIVYNSVCS